MLPIITLPRYCCAAFSDVDNYRPAAGDALIDEVRAIAGELRGLRVCHLNSTSTGGGVAELLSRHVPLSRALGLAADWRLMIGSPEFFTVTKAMHNGLQGSPAEISPSDRELYLDVNRKSARMLESEYDIFVLHDPQPAAFREAAGARGAAWIWRCHIDTSSPNPSYAAFLLPYLNLYDAAVFTLRDFALPGLAVPRVEEIAPAIDPLSTKNMDLPADLCRQVVANAGVDLGRPIVLQVSRFDPWKDPMGVLQAYRIAREQVPGLQLALVGAMAGDDPEGWRLLSQVEEEASGDPDIFVLTNLEGVGSVEVNAFQRIADLVIQKSLKEGFGLVVSESFWKGKPMVCGRAGGIPMQYPAGYGKYLVDSPERCAEAMVALLRDREESRAFGEAARDHVRKHFLLPRLLRDELRLFQSVLAGVAAGHAAGTG